MDEPFLEPVDYFWLRAFGELSTCRSTGFGLGDIPWTAIIAYGERVGLSSDMVDTLVLIIRQMEVSFRQWHEDEADRRSKAPGRQIGNKKVKR